MDNKQYISKSTDTYNHWWKKFATDQTKNRYNEKKEWYLRDTQIFQMATGNTLTFASKKALKRIESCQMGMLLAC